MFCIVRKCSILEFCCILYYKEVQYFRMLLHFETRSFYDISNLQNQDPLACLLALNLNEKLLR